MLSALKSEETSQLQLVEREEIDDLFEAIDKLIAQGLNGKVSCSGGDENGDSTIQIDLTSILHSAVSASSQGRLSDTPCVSRWSHGVSWRCRSCRLVHASRCCFVASLGGENHFGSDHHALTTLDWSFLRSFDPSDHHVL
ncbi:hypothetical protein YC2023_016070 [Brassica napus]